MTLSEAIGAVLAFAVGVGVSPIPIIAVILVLFSQRAKVNGPAFLGGWLVGLAIVVTVIYLIADTRDVGTSETADDTVAWLRLALGVALLVGAWRKWTHRPRVGDEPTMPAWMARIDGFTPRQAGRLGLLLSVNPKNLALATGAGTSLAQVGAGGVEAIAALVAFVLVASAAVITAVVYDLLGGERARASLEDARSWLLLHNSAVMTVLFLVFGAVLVSQALGLRS